MKKRSFKIRAILDYLSRPASPNQPVDGRFKRFRPRNAAAADQNIVGGLEVFPPAQVIHEVGQRLVVVLEIGPAGGPFVKPQDGAAGARGEVEGLEDHGRG